MGDESLLPVRLALDEVPEGHAAPEAGDDLDPLATGIGLALRFSGPCRRGGGERQSAHDHACDGSDHGLFSGLSELSGSPGVVHRGQPPGDQRRLEPR